MLSTTVLALGAALVGVLTGVTMYWLLRGPQTATLFTPTRPESPYRRRTEGWFDYWHTAYVRTGGRVEQAWLPGAVMLAAPVAAALLVWFVTAQPLLGLVAAAATVGLPYYILRRQQAGRGRAIDRELPGFIDNVRVALHSGTLEQALRQAAKSANPPLDADMAALVDDLDARIPLADALHRLAHRSASESMMVACATMEMFINSGAQNIQSILRELSNELVEIDRFNKEMRANTFFLRMAKWLAVGIPIAVTLYAFTANPASWFTWFGLFGFLIIAGTTVATHFYLGRLLKKSMEVA
jgi:Flp pilus assembly protein TadB